MDEDNVPIGAPITLAELKALGGFVRWQEINARVAELAAVKVLPNGYPLLASRLPAGGMIDLSLGGRWQQVDFVRVAGNRMSGDRRLVYRDRGVEKSVAYDWYGVAPQGHYSAWADARPESLTGVTLVLNTGSGDYATRAWCMLELMMTAMYRAPRPTLLNPHVLILRSALLWS